MSNTKTHGGSFYDLDRIKSIPILEICQALGIDYQEKGGRFWCRIRDERTQSVLLHTETQPNSYIDFGGSNKRSDVIQFVCEIMGTSRGDAIKYLAETFNISAEKQQENSTELNDWEYKKLGLYGDLATKNFTFDFERQGIERIQQLSEKYGIPMNDLRKKYPKIYEQLLRDKAVPMVRDMRNGYYLNVINMHHTAQIANVKDFTKLPDVMATFESNIKDLRTAERLLQKAAAGTSIKAMPVGQYDPASDLQKILAGEIKPAIGNHNYAELKAAAKDKHCDVKYRTVPWDKFSFMGLDDHAYSAFYKGDNIVIGYLECDHAALKPYLDAMSGKAPLGDKIAEAQSKQEGSARPAEPHKHYQAER